MKPDTQHSWLLRWKPWIQPQPEVILPQETRSDFAAHIHNHPAGWVLFEGYLFDKNDYLSGPSATAAACIARAYADQGEELFDQLRGGYALAVWDDRGTRLLAGRDAMGLHPLYYFWDDRLFLLSPDLDLILRQPEVLGSFNRVLLAEFLHDIWHEHQHQETFYEEIHRLPPAHRLCLQGGLLEIRRYWDPLPPGFEWAGEAELRDLPLILEQAVSRCLQVGADSISLSGGFDSVSLAVLASEQLNGRSPLQAVCLRFDIAGTDEWETQAAVARRLGMPQVTRSVSEFMRQGRVAADTLDILSKCPLPLAGLLQSLYGGLYRSGSAQGLSKIVMGTGGDEMFIVDVGYAADLLRSFDLVRLWRYYRTIARAAPTSSLSIANNIFWAYTARLYLIQLLRSTLEALSPRMAEAVRRRHLALEPWLAPSDPMLKEDLLHRRLYPPEVERASGEGQYARAIRRLAQSSNLMFHMEQTYTWTEQAGLTVLYPYFDRDLVQLSLRLHPEHLVSGGLAKAPLRRLVAERLPGVSMPARKLSFTKTYHAILRQEGPSVWGDLGGPTMLADLGLVAPVRLNPIIEGYFAGKNHNIMLVWNVLSAETWLRARAN